MGQVLHGSAPTTEATRRAIQNSQESLRTLSKPYVERYNQTVRHEWLGQYVFNTIEEAQDHATRWLWTYNNERPNMAIGGITPAMKHKTAA